MIHNNSRFKNSSDLTSQWIDVTDEHFIVWMRFSPFKNPRKVWGRIDQDLELGSYTLKVNSNWDASIYGGEKRVILATTNSMGGKGIFLSICYLIVGALALVLAIGFIIRKLIRPKGNLESKVKTLKK